ncbi:HU family DNA-binding protein [Magnetococcus marinus MC-1]|uniref:HU family DNA-binding protein n=1 Tax=Magnetococcus marinus (strain ATCC BAA-1437 / JCM 17883 / MC-1) TaxID=156889 RepID=A0L640_MAGMM|nr:HU family DNA-binding protein [Magnetococcus marinus]ABK43433.1 HU family DNA-binding protein [Magnetococcus marinus MC-1]
MNLGELKKIVADKTGMSQADAGRAVAATLEAISESLGQSATVSLLGFGTFSVGERAAREGRNPQTGEKINISASRTIRFKAGQSLREKVNG